MNIEKLITPDFWQTLLTKAGAWAMASVPAIVVIILLAIIGRILAAAILNKMKPLMTAHIRRGVNLDAEEIDKRVGTLFGILNAVLKIAVWSIAFMLILRNVGIDIGPIIAGAGIIGLAVGFGAQELVRDFISGFFMLLENQVREGDVAIVNGTGGIVENVGLRTIVLRDLSGVVHVFQNGKISTLANMTKEWSAMVFDVGVAYKEDTDAVSKVMQEVFDELNSDDNFKSMIIEPMEIMGVDAFGDSAVVIKARIKTKPIKQWAVGREYRRRLKKAFDARDIEIPFPHQTIYWGVESDAMKVKTLMENN